MKNLSYSIYFLILNLCLFGQDYLWPTNASNTLTAFFAEERPRRYHAGIDIRTYGKIGFETYAIEDGYIDRIKVDYKGYGKTLYLKLDDGNIAVYAHLDKFSPEVDNIIRILKKKYNSQVFEHKFDKNEVTFKKGEIVGYTGDTGTISGPHLHFEIRDKNNISLNPLLYYSNLEDDIAPIPKKIAIIPKSKNTKIDNFSDIALYEIIKNNNSEYFIKDTISVIGEFGISLSIIDKINKQPFTYGLYNLELYINGEIKYKVEYNEHNFSDGNLVLKERNYNLKRTYNERFYNLFNSTPNLSFIDKRSWPKYKLDSGIHNLIIKAKDINNNNIIIFGTIAAYDNEEIIYKVNETEQFITFNIEDKNGQRDYSLAICDKYSGDAIDTINITEKSTNISKSALKDPFNIIHLFGKSANGLKTQKYYFQSLKEHNESINGDFIIQTFKHGALIQFKEKEFSNKASQINIIKKDTILSYDAERISQNIITTNIIDFNDFQNALKLEIEYKTNPKISKQKLFNGSIFRPGQGLYIKKDNFIVDNITNFINDSMLIWISDYSIINNDDFNLISKPYNLQPKTLVFNKNLDIYFEYEKEELGIGIYFFDQKKRNWTYLKTDYKNKKYHASVLSNEIFCLIKENNAPEINNLIPNINSTYKFQDLDKLSFSVKDDLSGISNISNISVKINNNPILFEFNPYRKEVSYIFEEDLLEGNHSIEIEVKDNVGNAKTIKGDFYIK